jgi:hypothetical protein
MYARPLFIEFSLRLAGTGIKSNRACLLCFLQ